MNNIELSWRCVKRVDQCEQEAVWRAGEFATFEATAPTHISIATKHTTTGTLKWKERILTVKFQNLAWMITIELSAWYESQEVLHRFSLKLLKSYSYKDLLYWVLQV